MPDLFDFRPDLNASTLEPSLREILFRYYKPYFSFEEATRLTEQYLTKFNEALGDIITKAEGYQ